MNYINKKIAEETAFNMLSVTREKIERKKDELSKYCEKLVLDSIPTDIWTVITSLADGWIKMQSTFCFKSNNSYCYESIGKSIRYKYLGDNIHVSNEQFEKIKLLQLEIKEMKEKESQIKKQIITTLLKLRTGDKIKKEFPEAFKCIPKDSLGIKPLPSLPIEQIIINIDNFPK